MTAEGAGTSKGLGRSVVGELLRRGWSRLAALLGGHCANFGDGSFQTYSRIASLEEMRRPDGRAYHPESIGRVARRLQLEGVLSIERVHVGQKIPHVAAKHRSSHGTTVKRFDFAVIQQRNPWSRRQRRVQRMEQAAALRNVGDLCTPPPAPNDRPRHSSPAPSSPAPLGKLQGPPELVAIARQAIAAQEARAERERARRESQRSEPASGRGAAPGARPPPD